MESKVCMIGACTLFALAQVAEAKENPNIILIMADDLGWGDVGFNGNKIIKTPALDKLASKGVVFDRFYSGCSVSSPTRASVLTGRNPFRTGVFNANNGILRPEEVALPELLRDHGYATGHFGKWHLGTLTYTERDANLASPQNKHFYNPPAQHGYDDSFVTESKVPTYDPMKQPMQNNGRFWNCLSPEDSSKVYGTSYWLHDGQKATANLDGDDSRVIIDRVLPFIDKAVEAEQAFFSVVWFHTPHLPCVAGPEYAAMYSEYTSDEQNYYGCITAMDDQIARLVAHLKAKGVYDNTIICFCSDNGPEVRTPGSAAHLKGMKRDLYEGGIRVPSFVVWGNEIKDAKRVDTPCYTSDYLPSIADVLNLPLPKRELDGVSLVDVVVNGGKREKPLVFAYLTQAAIIDGDYKLYYNKGVYEMYNIRKDASEESNIIVSNQERAEQMKMALHTELNSCKASFNGEEYGTESVMRMRQSWHDVFAQ